MSYSLEFKVSALKAWDKLDASVKTQFKARLKERLINPHVMSARLSGMPDCYKIKLRSVGYRLVYQVNDKMKTLCEGEIIITATKEQQNRRDLERVNERVNTINEIADRMAKAKDTKEAQDLGNAMQTQIALLQADNIQRDIQAKQFEQQERLIEQQAWNEMARANYEATRSFKSLTD